MEEKKALIIHYLENYRKSDHDNGMFNYYQIFDLDCNMEIEQIKKSVKEKKLKVVLHPDWIGYLDEKDQEDFEYTEKVV